MIPFNKPYITGKEVHYIYDAVSTGKLSGNGKYTKMCQQFFENNYGFKKTLLTTSCTDALEMCALLLDIEPGDEVIVPSYTFVSTALAFVRQGAKIIFVDSRADHPGLDEDKLEALITPRTKAIVPVHYAGVACDMDKVMDVANRHGIFVVEDAAQGVDSYYESKIHGKQALGSIGHLSAFSFHETKNIQSGEGGMLAINDDRFVGRAEIIWEKGTNRAEFFRGEVDKYSWVDTGSSFLPSEITAAFLWAQLNKVSHIQKQRKAIWQRYQTGLRAWAEKNNVRLPYVPENTTNNAHMFYLVCSSLEQRTTLINRLRANGAAAVFHYLSLHESEFYRSLNESEGLVYTDIYTNCLVRLPLFVELSEADQQKVIDTIITTSLE